MTWEILEAKQARFKLVEDQKALHSKAASEKRDFTAEEKTEWEKREADIDRMTVEIDRFEKLLAVKDEEAAKRDMTGIKPGEDAAYPRLDGETPEPLL